MRCSICRKEDKAFFTVWDHIRSFVFNLFVEDIQDFSEEKYSKGFGEGYEMGFKTAMEKKVRPTNKEGIAELMKRWEKS